MSWPESEDLVSLQYHAKKHRVAWYSDYSLAGLGQFWRCASGTAKVIDHHTPDDCTCWNVLAVLRTTVARDPMGSVVLWATRLYGQVGSQA